MHINKSGIFPLPSSSGPDGLVKVILSNSQLFVEICSVGASIIGIYLPTKNGDYINGVLNYKDPKAYLTDSYYLGYTIGRVAGRVRSANLPVDGQIFCLSKNDGDHHLHGGHRGFDKKVFEVLYQENYPGKSSTKLRAYSEAWEEGYPGRVKLEVTYTLDEDNTLRIDYEGETDGATHLNITNHSYFNLSGRAQSGLEQQLQIISDQIQETDTTFLPSGKKISVQDTPYDFNTTVLISERKSLIGEKFFNESYILSPTSKPNAVLIDPLSNRKMELRTSYPALLFYSGDYLSNPFSPCEGICLEAQFLVDSPNIDNFSTLLKPDKKYCEFIELKFNW